MKRFLILASIEIPLFFAMIFTMKVTENPVIVSAITTLAISVSIFAVTQSVNFIEAVELMINKKIPFKKAWKETAIHSEEEKLKF